MKLIQQLRAVGAQAEVDLPRIAVIGNQSAGKSSLVEAITGINVPRDSGTCTRCPMECRLTQSTQPWQCQLSLRFEFDDAGHRRDEVKETLFGKPISDKDKMEMAIRRAQAAILSPSIPSHEFLDFTDDEIRTGRTSETKRPLQFSKNVVCLDISGPNVTELAFVDLPGIIQNAEKDLVDLVENLVVEHIKGNCIILVALPMSDDIENQKAALLARQHDPKGRRTIGVLTKPDSLTAGNRKSKQLWLEVIEGSRHPLKHGYFCTRQPDEDERFRGITFEEARQREMEFFEQNEPWRDSSQPGRFGTVNLSKRLSELLMQIIDDSLPSLQAEITSLYEKCQSQLRLLPPPVTEDPSGYLMSLISEFSSNLGRLIDGSPATLVHQNTDTYRKFSDKIRRTRPSFQAMPKGESSWSGSSDSDEGFVMYIDEVRDHIREAKTRELPFSVPYKAKVSLIQKIARNWEAPTYKCFEAVHHAFNKEINALIDEYFARFGRLQSQVKTVIAEEIAARKEATKETLQLFLDFETTPFTQNTHYYEDKRNASLSEYLDKRQKQSGGSMRSPTRNSSSSNGGSIREVLTELGKLGISDLDPGMLLKLSANNNSDVYMEEITLMADVRAYIAIAYKRLIDNVPLAVDHTFLFKLKDTIQKILIKRLKVGSVEVARDFLMEDPAVQAEREALTVKRKRLEEMKRQLYDFGS
jgi:GTP-binding protein EngB required for normal cell division